MEDSDNKVEQSTLPQLDEQTVAILKEIHKGKIQKIWPKNVSVIVIHLLESAAYASKAKEICFMFYFEFWEFWSL